MKHFRIIIALVAISTALTVNSQDDNFQFSIFNFQFSEVLDSIEKNNTTLIALRTEAEARKLENRTGITLADPEVGYKHMWEGADETGKLTPAESAFGILKTVLDTPLPDEDRPLYLDYEGKRLPF